MKNNSSALSIFTPITARVISSASRKYWLSVLLCFFAATCWADNPASVHAIALHGTPKYASDFAHFDYVNPDAPKGGQLRLGVVGSFDSLNPFIIKGLAATGEGMVFQTLLEKSLDEPLTSYGLLAENITMPEDRSWVAFDLRPEARWDDGKPVTVEDVIWSFNTLMKDGQPFYRSYYSQVAKVEKQGDRGVKFTFKVANNRELPLIVGDMPVLPKHYWTSTGHDFSKTTLTAPMGSGPYRIKSVNAGRQITFERVKNWWGENLPLNKGRYNFDTVVYDYYRDPGVAFQAFLGGNIDFRQENIAKTWAQEYNHPAVKSGKIKRDEFKHGLPTGLQAFVYNTRRAIFSDPRVREALGYAFDFEWANKQLAFGSYVRCNSYFSNSDLAARDLPNPDELKLLNPYRKDLPPRVFTTVYQPPKTNGSGDTRTNLRQALALLKEAGWNLQDGVLKNKEGQAFSFELLTDSPMFDRWVLPFISNLKKLGIAVNLRSADSAQYQNRMNDFDFDMTIASFPESLTPGNEQFAYWGSQTADEKGSMNLMGIKSPVVDGLITHIVHAPTRSDLVNATRALDRVLLWNFYVIPQWYIDTFRIAYWDRLARPAVNPPYGLPVVDTWWSKTATPGK